MAVSLIINGVTYNYPQLTDEGWGDDATNWAVAITQGTLQKNGGLFVLTADTDFGPSFGLKSLYYKSRSANIALSGQIRLANADSLKFRNAGNTADLGFGPGSSDAIPQYNSIDLVNLSTAQTLSNKTFTSSIFTGNTFNSPIINTPTVTGGTFSSPSISNPTFTGTSTFVDLSTSGTTTIGDAFTDLLTVTAVSRFNSGTVSVPSISFTAAPSTGLFLSGGSLAFTFSGSQKAQFTASAFELSTFLRLPNGSASSPILSFNNDSATGLYLIGTNNLGISTNGTLQLDINTTRILAGLQIHSINGNSVAPGYAFASDSTSGIYNAGSSTLAISTATIDRMTINATAISLFSQLRANDGSISLPSYSFTNSINSGMYLATGSDTVVLASAGTNSAAFTNSLFSIFVPVSTASLITAASLLVTGTTTLGTSGQIIDPMQSVTLADATTNGVAISNTTATSSNWIVDYSITRGTTRETGQLMLTTDGTTAQVAVQSTNIGDPGVSFTADISGANTRLLYTTTATGSSAAMRFVTRRWIF